MVPQLLGYSVQVLSVFVPFAFQFMGYLLKYLQAQIFFLSPFQSANLLMNPSRHSLFLSHFFFSATFFFSAISIWFFLRIFISPLMVHIYYCMLSILCIKVLSILIIVLNSLSDNASIPAVHESEYCFVFSNCVFVFFFVLLFLIIFS